MVGQQGAQLEALSLVFVHDSRSQHASYVLFGDGDCHESPVDARDALGLLHILGVSEDVFLHGPDVEKVAVLAYFTQLPQQLGLEVQKGRLLAQQGRLEGARGMLKGAASKAERSGLVEIQLRALDALAAVEAEAGSSTEAEALRAQVQGLAEGKGMLLFAPVSR